MPGDQETKPVAPFSTEAVAREGLPVYCPYISRQSRSGCLLAPGLITLERKGLIFPKHEAFLL